MHADPQTLAREMVAEVDHPVAGRVRTIGAPVKFSHTPCRVEKAAPLLGQHARELLAEFGYNEIEIGRLVSSGAVLACPIAGS
jgi:crotonobetainyl-CoA:carnitine CoA-transferase CaiB-like acyl-CoA transferase